MKHLTIEDLTRCKELCNTKIFKLSLDNSKLPPDHFMTPWNKQEIKELTELRFKLNNLIIN